MVIISNKNLLILMKLLTTLLELKFYSIAFNNVKNTCIILLENYNKYPCRHLLKHIESIYAINNICIYIFNVPRIIHYHARIINHNTKKW